MATLLYLALQVKANTNTAKYNEIINRVIKWQSRIADTPDLMQAWTAGTKRHLTLTIENQVRFTSIAVEMQAAIEATFETAKTNGIKPESVTAVKAMLDQLIRNNSVRKSWDVSGRNLFAQDFVWEVDVIIEPARHADPSNAGPLPFYMPTLARKLKEHEAIEKPLQK